MQQHVKQKLYKGKLKRADAWLAALDAVCCGACFAIKGYNESF
jgi:hypothetical protein